MKSSKRRHIDVCLDGDVSYVGATTGLERYRLPCNSLTQTNLDGCRSLMLPMNDGPKDPVVRLMS